MLVNNVTRSDKST